MRWVRCGLVLFANMVMLPSTGAHSDSPWSGQSELCDLSHQRAGMSLPQLEAQDSICLTNSTEGSSSNSHFETNEKDAQSEWRFNYIYEQEPGFRLLVKDNSIDERLSNIIYTVQATRFINTDSHRINLQNRDLEEEIELASAGENYDDKLCESDLREMITMADELSNRLELRRKNSNYELDLDEKYFRLARVMEAYGRYESGTLSGRVTFTGSFHQCVGTDLILGKPGTKRKARYCVARLRGDRHLSPSLRAREKPMHEMDQILISGICIPGSCHTRSYRNHSMLFKTLVDRQFLLPETIFVDKNLDLDGIFCQPDENNWLNTIPQSGKLFIAFVTIWLVCVLYSTYRHEKLHGHSAKSGLDSMSRLLSLRESYEDFIECERGGISNKRINLNTLNTIKVLGSCYVVLGHSLLAQLGYPTDPLRAMNYMESSSFVFLVFGGTVVVDSFFVITGILMTFITLNRLSHFKSLESEEQQSVSHLIYVFFKQWFNISAKRYLRLLPLYFLVFWLKKSLLLYLSTGPLWDHGSNLETPVGSCKVETWLTPIASIGSYLPLSKQCLPQAWSISNDMIFSIILTPIILGFDVQPIVAITFSIVASIASNLAMLNGVESLDTDLKRDLYSFRMHGIIRAFNEASFTYSMPHYRVSSVLIGAIAGYLAYHYERSTIKKWPWWLEGPTTKISLACIFLISSVGLLVPYIRTTLTFHHYVFSLQLSAIRLIWATVSAVVLLRMITDWKDTYLMRQSAGRFWQTAAKLNYSILLVHMDIIHASVLSKTHSEVFSITNVVYLFASSYLLSVVVSTVLYILFENPMEKLVKVWIFDKIIGSGEVERCGKGSTIKSTPNRMSDNAKVKSC